MKKVVIEIEPGGNFQFSFEGFKGKGCVTEHNKIVARLREAGLGYSQTDQKFTEEFRLTDDPMQKNRERN